MTAEAMTERQQAAIEALEGARREGLTLKAYAEAHGQKVTELYWTIAALRRRGLVPKSSRVLRSKFLAVRVEPRPPMSPQVTPAGGVVCRIQVHGFAIECTQWPEPSWVSALASRSSDAAT